MADETNPGMITTGDRREFLRWCAGIGLTGAALAEAGRAMAQAPVGGPAPIADAVLAGGAELAGLDFTAPEREMMAAGAADNRDAIRRLRQVSLGNEVAPALIFTPLLPGVVNLGRPREEIRGPYDVVTGASSVRSVSRTKRHHDSRAPIRPPVPSDLAFLTIGKLSRLIESGELTSRELTEVYLDRLQRFDPQLECVITLTAELARRQADLADAEIRAGRYRGPLHGIPYGAKDLLATRGIQTTWGAEPFRGQVPREDATVIHRLAEAGAVLVAKTAVGALAYGDVWFGGTTRNPWKPDQGSSGSSAGSSSGTAAGLFAFAIGTETLGSIVSPCTRCGTTGLRPTFGRVSRHGAMALSWSMDKIGPIARSVGDCALVFDAIHGADGRDVSVHDAPFNADIDAHVHDWTSLRIGYDKVAFDEAREEKGFDDDVLEAMRRLGVSLVPMTFPDLPVNDTLLLLECEAAAAFDELTRTNQDEQLKRQTAQAWPNIFRTARLIPAVEYIQANRIRTLLIQQFDQAMADIDVYLSPTYGGISLRATNLTGHPCVVLPSGFRADSTPASVTFMGRLFGEEALLAVARAYQDSTGWHRRRPAGFA
ncbi:MAG: amidase [Candidatus Eisenbacteria bacterium]|nr:amidase [Candidatus Eisenbacteria bacterium]